MDNLCMNRIKAQKILVIGDVMLDEYYFGSVSRISPEAPVPVFLKKGHEYRPGGAANVAVNMAVNGMDVTLISVIGEDGNGAILEGLLERHGIPSGHLVRTGRPTSTKCRLLAGGSQQVLRVDEEDSSEIDVAIQDTLLEKLDATIRGHGIAVISDYLKGVLTFEATRQIIDTCNGHGVRVLADVKDRRAEKYAGAYLIKPNRKELALLTGMSVSTGEEVASAAGRLRGLCGSSYVLATCGADGMVLVDRAGGSHRLGTASREVFDVTGAGDTVIAYLAMCLANGVDILDAVKVSNIAAGIQVSKVGTSPVLLSEAGSYGAGAGTEHGKRIGLDGLRSLRESNPEKRIVFTNGCFDILHIGHLRYLEQASRLGDILVVGLNSDRSVCGLKGSGRPVNPEGDRLEMLSYLDFIDYIAVFDDPTPYAVIGACGPDVLVKGGDYAPEDVVGKDIVESRGGEVVILPLVEGKSTTGIISRIESVEIRDRQSQGRART